MKRFQGRRSIRASALSLVVAWLSLAGGNAFALASGSVVFDPTNWAENLRSATMSVKQYAQDIVRTKHMFDQLQHAIKNREKLLASALFAGMDDQQRRAALESIRFYDELQTLEKDLDALQGRYDLKVKAAYDSNRTVGEFMKITKQEADRGVKASQQSIQQDVRTLQRVQETYASVKKWQMQTDANMGHMESLQLMNTQMNALVGQNAEVISALTKASLERSIAEVNKRESEAVAAERHRAMAEASKQLAQEAAEAMDAQMKNAGPVRPAK